MNRYLCGVAIMSGFIVHRLSGANADLLRLCAHITPRNRINAALSARYGEDAVDDAIASLVADGFVIAEDDYVLALPLRQPRWRRAPSWDDLLRGQPVLA